MDFALIGINKSKYAVAMIKRLISFNLIPKYVIIEHNEPRSLAVSSVFIDSQKLPVPKQNLSDWAIEEEEGEFSLGAVCSQESIPFLTVPSHNGRQPRDIIAANPIDILIITEGPIIRGPIIYMPRLCVMNIHAAPLPQYRGNWTTRFALYNDEPPIVSAHVVTPWIDEGPIIERMHYEINLGDTLEEIDLKAMNASAELAVYSLLKIMHEGFAPNIQRIWEGKVYKGTRSDKGLEPAMPLAIQRELKARLLKGEYGFYAK
ncbi:formyltransferase family protein [Desulforamulus ferrireducens]|uniref:Formyl transferase N-terminal domain-containing protein n=1 Tax=Desulforamulus ferrireducens TaxID=1833852 RepID=A0A1S6J019_9FIRM|nr:formyltransferase family protein [Desulforamulus ferrireducens]AQS60358.1 hypothetical protein B0537_15565 [Desulforamulus ferrireducens]